ncbi:MAG: hypothetical protein IKJ65_03150 [Clostridia bacterium]|nr:hypothetical protein [Clostridia bacterium]
MTFLRVIKWISFVVFVLAIALTGVAHGFIFNEMGLFCKDAEAEYMLSEVRNAVQAEDDIISSLFNKEEKPAEETGNAAPTPVGSTVSEPVPVGSTPAPAASGYSCEDVNEIIVHVMKYGSYQIEMSWFNKLLNVESFKINLSILVGYIALFVAFILHIITKRTKTFYGCILMIVGYIFYAGLIALGYYAGAYYIGTFEATFVSNDIAFYRTCTIIGGFALATIVGVPYYRLGIRQIANKTYKKRIDNYRKKLQRRGA